MGMEGIELRESRSLSPRDMILHKLEDLDDDGKPKRTGTMWTASAHIITAVIGSGVLSLAWAMSQLGWVAGPVTLVLFSIITFFTSSLLTDCYRTSDPISGKRNYTYNDAVKSILGGTQVWMCGLCQYVNLCGVAIGYTITASISAAAISKSNCYHRKGHKADCNVSDSFYMIGFGIIQFFLSQLPNFHDLWWLSIVAAVMSFAYSGIAVGLSFARVISGNTGKTSLTGQEVGVDITSAQKIWETFQALGDIAFAYSYSIILIEIQDTLKSPPAENKVMKKASFIGVSTTTIFYILSGCLGYAAFGNHSPGNILTGFGFYEPYWLVDLANFCIIVHLVGAYQVFAQPVFAAVEKWIIKRNPNMKILNKELTMIHVKSFKFNVNMFRLIWRSIFVALATLLAILMPFFNDILGFLGAASFWPLTVYFPTEMYIVQKNIEKFSGRWILFKTLSFLCFFVSLAAACGSIEGVIDALHHYTPFQTKS
ncbi:Amino acid transporters domain-containing protein [Dioscorea alata]|uniref:Amino acid transporters domain-containing protein n=1 Tax=Dioscorea alata TaxID=55571 RepID=A0ACB7UBL7_DIOAL|nr:Amino acid transporters domain-containing protein [Dioscorea alata]